MTDESIIEKIASGKVVELGHELSPTIPVSPNHPGFKIALLRRHGDMVRDDGQSASNEMILMVKATSLVSTITLMEVTGIARLIIAKTFSPVEVFIVAGTIYLLMTFIIHNFIKIMEKKFDYQTNK